MKLSPHFIFRHQSLARFSSFGNRHPCIPTPGSNLLLVVTRACLCQCHCDIMTSHALEHNQSIKNYQIVQKDRMPCQTHVKYVHLNSPDNVRAVVQQNCSKQVQSYVKLVNCYTKPLMTSINFQIYFIDNKFLKAKLFA